MIFDRCIGLVSKASPCTSSGCFVKRTLQIELITSLDGSTRASCTQLLPTLVSEQGQIHFHNHWFPEGVSLLPEFERQGCTGRCLGYMVCILSATPTAKLSITTAAQVHCRSGCTSGISSMSLTVYDGTLVQSLACFWSQSWLETLQRWVQSCLEAQCHPIRSSPNVTLAVEKRVRAGHKRPKFSARRGEAGNRNLYLPHAKRALYQMSYIPSASRPK